MASACRRIALAAAAIAFIAAACGGSDPGDETLEDGREADTADYHGDPDIDTDSADHRGDTDTDTDSADYHGDPDIDADSADHHDTTDTADTTDDHASAGTPTQYDADVADAAQTVTVEVVGGAPAGGHQRVEVDLGSVVALMVTSDTAAEVHVHSYDILRAVSDGHPAHFAFTAEIPGVFEVELEGSGRLLLQLEIS